MLRRNRSNRQLCQQAGATGSATDPGRFRSRPGRAPFTVGAMMISPLQRVSRSEEVATVVHDTRQNSRYVTKDHPVGSRPVRTRRGSRRCRRWGTRAPATLANRSIVVMSSDRRRTLVCRAGPVAGAGTVGPANSSSTGGGPSGSAEALAGRGAGTGMCGWLWVAVIAAKTSCALLRWVMHAVLLHPVGQSERRVEMHKTAHRRLRLTPRHDRRHAPPDRRRPLLVRI